jgi:hypothetical protein
VGGDHRFWFTTFPELTVASVLTGPIWARAWACAGSGCCPMIAGLLRRHQNDRSLLSAQRVREV